MYKAKWIYWLLQLIGWGAFIGLLAISEYITQQFSKTTLYQLLILYVLLLSITHLMRFVLLKFEWVNLRIKRLIPRVLLLNLLSAVLLTFLMVVASNVLSNKSFSWSLLPSILLNTLVYALFLLMWTSIYLTYHLFQKNRKQELVNVELKASKIEMELENLRNQLNPHFLFNSLNSIRALIQEEPEKAKNAVNRLSGVLRGSLQMGKKSLVSLAEEKQLVADYLELEKIRYEERLEYTILDTTKKEWFIPPFCVQTLAENAIKHGIGKLAKGGELSISFSEEAEWLTIVVKNSGTLGAIKGEGIGIENVKQRLFFQFGDNAYFHIGQSDKWVEAWIKLKKQK